MNYIFFTVLFFLLFFFSNFAGELREEWMI